jgi:hypothetical protein
MALKKTLEQKRTNAAEAACKALIKAYNDGEKNGGSIEWSDLDHAHQLALKAFPNKEKK